MRKYTEEEKVFMREYVPGHSHREIQAEFNRRFSPEITTDQVKSYIKNNHLNTGRTGQFPKGTVPPNKGKKVSPETYEKMAPTMFKKGNLPKNTDPIGTEKMLADGYVWVKIDDQPKAKKQVNWKQKHHLIWEQHNGPIPERSLIIFKDGDRENFDISNLACVTRAEHARLNQGHLRKEDPDLTEAGILIAKIRTSIGEARKKRRATDDR